ncbi:MAG: hypothetical protein U0163_13710 [Gemmatimonadaceae bacterium]
MAPQVRASTCTIRPRTSGPRHRPGQAPVSPTSGVLNGLIISTGGYNTTSILGTSEYLDALGGQWLPRASIPAAVSSASSAARMARPVATAVRIDHRQPAALHTGRLLGHRDIDADRVGTWQRRL